jgi:D-alanyl-D-alanine carboxypeptidase (penicillin-binding protein 5/6)
MSSFTGVKRVPSHVDRLATIALCCGLVVGGSASASFASPPPSPTASATAAVAAGDSIPLPKMRTWTWVVADADTGAVLAGRDWKWPLPPASTLKTLTALTLVDRLQLDSKYRVSKADSEAEGSRVGIKPGSQYQVNDLFNGMLMPSGNDAATALANAYGGMERTTEAMNAEAQRLGAEQTVVKNTSGLDEPGQTSSAYDLALIMRESLKNPELRRMYLQHDVQFPAEEPADSNEERKTIKIWTENRLVLNDHEGALAGKTGFTSQAGRTFVGAMERDGRTLIVALMRSAESTERAVTRVFDWTFANYDKLSPVDQLANPGSKPEVAAQPAVAYDGGGVSNLAEISPDAVVTSDSKSTPLLLAFVLAVIAGAIIWRRRVVAAANQRRRARPTRDVASSNLDLRDRDKSTIS